MAGILRAGHFSLIDSLNFIAIRTELLLSCKLFRLASPDMASYNNPDKRIGDTLLQWPILREG